MSMTNQQVADFIDAALAARLADNRPPLVAMINRLLDDPTGEGPLLVVSTMAKAVSTTLTPEPGQDWYAFRPFRYTPAGPVECSADELRPWDRTFGQMTVALANGEQRTSAALYAGYVNHQRSNAGRLVVVGLHRLAHIVTCPECCPDGLRGWLA